MFANKTLEAGVVSLEQNEQALKEMLDQCQISCQVINGFIFLQVNQSALACLRFSVFYSIISKT